MGVHENIGINKFPKQSEWVGLSVEVCFNYDTTNTIKGIFIRDDREEPGISLIQLEDGRVVLSTECQHSIPYLPKKTIKPYSEVEIGDKAYSSENKEFIGIVTWLGKAKDLHPNELLDWEMTATEIDNDYDILKVDEKTGAFDDCVRLYNYNGDPSGVICYKD